MFADKAEIQIKAGKGGDGKMGFRHEKYRDKGGPDGGDGGRGGDVIFQVDHNLNTLARLKTTPAIQAEDGQNGGDNRRHGKSGKDTVIKVPMGTVVYQTNIEPLASNNPNSTIVEQRILADLTVDGQTAIIGRGGRGGFGNAHFTSSTRQTPRMAELGELGEQKRLILEMKLVADVGLVGLPNAGKSTLLSVITNAKPAIGDYPFTTLVPNLGVVDFDDNTILVADIPGLIEGASLGKGLGDEFLRHIERTSVLVHLIDATSSDPAADYRTVNEEIKSYNIDIVRKPQIVAFTKIDALDSVELDSKIKSFYNNLKLPKTKKIFKISAPAHRGLDDLLRALLVAVRADRDSRKLVDSKSAEIIIDESSLLEEDEVMIEGAHIYRLSGPRIEAFARRTNWNSRDAVERLRDIIKKTGLARELRRLGAESGSKVKIGENELEWL